MFSTAIALTAQMGTQVGTVNDNPVFAFDVLTLARALGVLVPILVALIAKSNATRAVKSIANLVLSAVVAVVAPIIAGQGAPGSFSEFFNSLVNAFTVGIISYYGLLKPTGITDALTRATSSFGIGGKNNTDATGNSTTNPLT